MVLFTMISRLRDSLPLAASMQNDEEVSYLNNFKQSQVLTHDSDSHAIVICHKQSMNLHNLEI